MALREKISRLHRTNHKLFLDNAREIQDTNAKILRQILRIGLIISGMMLLVVMFSSGYERLRPVYGVMLLFSIAMYIFFRMDRCKRYALPGLYLIFTLFFGLAVYLSVSSADVMAVSIVGLFCLMPLAFLDESWRIDLFMIALFFVHVGASWLLKTPETAFGDMVNGMCFLVAGMMLGANVREIKLENHEVKRLAQQQMDVDFLTGLYNRRKMFELLECCKAGNSRRKVAGIIMLDIDHFKEYNDQNGHLMGDECLRQLSALFRQLGKEWEIDFFRFGGEEFLVFCYEEQGDQIAWITEEIRRRVNELKLVFPDTETGFVTVSLGYAAAEQNEMRVDDQLVMMADKALYQAKDMGRNRSIGYC